MRIKIIYIAFILSFGFSLTGLVLKQQEESPVKIFKKIQANYHNFSTIELDLVYTVKDDAKPGSSIETFKGKVVSSKNNFFVQSIDSKSIFGKDLKLIISDEEQLIMYSKRDSNDRPNVVEYNIELIDSVELLTKNGLRNTVGRKYNMLSYQPLLPSFQKVQLFYEPNTFHIKGMNIHLTDAYKDPSYGEVKKPVIEIRYTKHIINGVIDETKYFNTSSYITKSGSTYVGVGKYAKYEIVDLNKEKSKN